MNMQNKSFIRFFQMALITLLVLGCFIVLQPFIAAILFAATICITTWPLYSLLTRTLRGRTRLTAFLMIILLTLVIVIPTVFLSLNLADAVELLLNKIRPALEQGLPQEPPKWLANLPLVGKEIAEHWHSISSSQDELTQYLPRAIEPIRKILLQIAALLGHGILQLLLVLFIAFFFYRDGAEIGKMLQAGAAKLGGELGLRLLGLARGTVNGVMIGIVGTAFGQAVVALIGLVIADVPGALLLGTATFFLSMIPIGPPLVWGGAAFWLYQQGETGWAIFMVLYGLLVISSVDNFLKPLLISRSASLPILLIALGVFGGVLVFGFIGIFLGPTLLALGHVLVSHWTKYEIHEIRSDTVEPPHFEEVPLSATGEPTIIVDMESDAKSTNNSQSLPNHD